MKKTLPALLLILGLLLPTVAHADPPVDPMRQPANTSPYGMDILGPGWQWTFPREYAEPWYQGPLRVDQADEVFRKAAAAGVRSARIAAWWCFIELERDQYYWTDLDAIIQISRNYGIEPIPEILYTPYWARADAKRTTSCINNWKRNYPPDNMNDWADFVEQMVRRYGPTGRNQVHYWEIWNEPDLPEFLSIVNDPGNGTVAVYADMLKAASQRIRRIDPKAKILLGGLSDIRGAHFLADLLDLTGARNVRNAFDIIPFHAFTAHEIKVTRILEPVTERGLSYEMWLNELNNSDWKNDYATAADRIDDLFALLDRYKITRTFWFKSYTTKWGPGIFFNRDPLWEVKPFLPSPFYDAYKKQTFPYNAAAAPTVGKPGPYVITSSRPLFTWNRPNAGSFPIAGYKLQIDNSVYKGTSYFQSPEADIWVPPGYTHFLPTQLKKTTVLATAEDEGAASESAPLSVDAIPTTPQVRYQLTQSLKPGIYYWRVAVVDTKGNVGAYSYPRAFVVTAGEQRVFQPLQRRP